MNTPMTLSSNMKEASDTESEANEIRTETQWQTLGGISLLINVAFIFRC